jgi:hypothetical protein
MRPSLTTVADPRLNKATKVTRVIKVRLTRHVVTFIT